MCISAFGWRNLDVLPETGGALRYFVSCFLPGELSSVGCFIHKTTRIVGGGPVGISDGSWMVSIQKGYSLAFNIPHVRPQTPEEETLRHRSAFLAESFFLSLIYGANAVL